MFISTQRKMPLAFPRPRLRVGIILSTDFTLSAFALFTDHLRLAADEGDLSRQLKASWVVMSSKGDAIRASCGLSVQPNSGFVDPRTFDYIVVVGGLLNGDAQVDAKTDMYLEHAASCGVTLVGLCTGSFILCRAGLMRGRRACVSWYHFNDFKREFPDHDVVADHLFLVDGDRITCSGGAGTGDLASSIIERHLGRAAAQKASQVLLLDRSRCGDDAQPHPPIGVETDDARVKRALLLMEQNLSRPLPIAQVARRLGVSTRHLERLCREAFGLSPGNLYRAVRLRYAKWLLETTPRSVTDIALEAGFADSAHFCRQYKEVYRCSPSAQRKLSPSSGLDPAAGRVQAWPLRFDAWPRAALPNPADSGPGCELRR